ncbi:alpha/beta-Hydrolases superfamily protein [Perilla frutescens var. frutescens]|nr:alpha/beta-Hydrolases superfamily protein [Perilla frutescens var. frutescens]
MNSNLMLTNLSIPNKNPYTFERVIFSSQIKFRTNLVVAGNQGMQQRITIPNKQGQKLIGVLHDTGSTNLVVLGHGFRASKESNTMVNLAVALENEGISAFRFDFSGNGESEGPFEYGNYSGEVEDLRAIVEYFNGVNRVTVGVLGHSKGGSVVLLYASKYHDIGAVVNVAGRYDLKSGIEKRLGENYVERVKKDGYIDVKTKTGAVNYRVTEKSLLERLNTNMHEACISIDNNCRVLTVHGSADDVIPVDDALEFAKIIPNHQLEIIEGADHKFSSHQDELASVVLRFIKEGLQ